MKFRNIESRRIFILFLIIPVSIGFLAFLLTRNNNFDFLVKPVFMPPSFLFPIVWTILYILMGISSYRIYESISYHRTTCLIIYALNLFLNFLWPLIFFNLEARLFAFIFILFLDVVVFFMILCFYGIDRKAGLYQIPYFLWLLFATILNFSVYFLNR